MAASRDLTAGPIGRTLVAFALPTLGSNVLQSLNGSINSSMRPVEIGSSAEVGSSNRMTSGRWATVRAMQRRCC